MKQLDFSTIKENEAGIQKIVSAEEQVAESSVAEQRADEDGKPAAVGDSQDAEATTPKPEKKPKREKQVKKRQGS